MGELVAVRRHVDPPFFCRKVHLAGWGRVGGTDSHGPSRESGNERVEDVLVGELSPLCRWHDLQR